MKTIRENIFETNSSSSHSIAIRKKDQSINSLNEDNILYPDRLHQSVIRSDINLNSVLYADTKDKKAALICHYIKEYYEREDEKIEFCFNFLCEKLNYKKINNFVSDFYPYSEYGEDLFNDDNNIEFDNIELMLNKFVELINDDNIVIEDKTEER